MSASHSLPPQRKPTGASDRIAAGTHYGLETTNVTAEPSSFSGGRFEKLTISPQSSLSPSGTSSALDAPPPLPPKVPADGALPRYATSRSGSVVVAPQTPQAVSSVDCLPPSPPRQRTVPAPLNQQPKSLASSARATAPLTPPLSPQCSDGRGRPPPRTASVQSPSAQPPGSGYSRADSHSSARPLPRVPPHPLQAAGPTALQNPNAVRPPRSPTVVPLRGADTRASAQPPTAGGSPSSPRQPGRVTAIQYHRTVQEPQSSATVDTKARAMSLNGPQPAVGVLSPEGRSARQPVRAATVAIEPHPPASARLPTADTARAPIPPTNVHRDTLSSQLRGPNTVGTASPPGDPQLPEQTPGTVLPIEKPIIPSPTAEKPAGQIIYPNKAGSSSDPSASSVASALVGTGPAVPPKVPSGPPLPDKQQSLASAPGKIVSSPQSTLDSTTSPPKVTTVVASASVPVPRKDRPKAEPKAKQKAAGKEPIKAVCYLDPCLKQSLLTIPASLTTTADATLSAVEAYPEHDFNWTIGAPIGGLGGLAKHYVLRPDAKFETENGGITLTLAVVDEVGGGVPLTPPADESAPAPPKGRTKARVEVRSDKGGILIDMKELDANRQVDLLVETRKGDVLVLLPETFLGPIHVRAEEEPGVGAVLQSQLDDVVNPYEDLWTTTMVPLGVERGAKKNKFRAHKFMKGVSKWVPEVLRGEDDYLGMAVSSYTTLKKGNQSKVLVKNPNGKVRFGLSGSKDEKELREGIKVGAEQGTKKHWWS